MTTSPDQYNQISSMTKLQNINCPMTNFLNLKQKETLYCKFRASSLQLLTRNDAFLMNTSALIASSSCRTKTSVKKTDMDMLPIKTIIIPKPNSWQLNLGYTHPQATGYNLYKLQHLTSLPQEICMFNMFNFTSRYNNAILTHLSNL